MRVDRWDWAVSFQRLWCLCHCHHSYAIVDSWNICRILYAAIKLASAWLKSYSSLVLMTADWTTTNACISVLCNETVFHVLKTVLCSIPIMRQRALSLLDRRSQIRVKASALSMLWHWWDVCTLLKRARVCSAEFLSYSVCGLQVGRLSLSLDRLHLSLSWTSLHDRAATRCDLILRHLVHTSTFGLMSCRYCRLCTESTSKASNTSLATRLIIISQVQIAIGRMICLCYCVHLRMLLPHDNNTFLIILVFSSTSTAPSQIRIATTKIRGCRPLWPHWFSPSITNQLCCSIWWGRVCGISLICLLSFVSVIVRRP